MAIINGYTLKEPPIKGGMALVYKGVKGPFSRAFKMVRPDKAANNPRLCQRFLQEINVQTSLSHPNIIKILDAYPYQDSKGITVTVLEMEWLEGMDLQRYIDQKSPKGMDVPTVTKIAHRVIDGLEYAHNHNILHLDIKPSNIFRTKDGYIKIIDFGIARVIGENAQIVDGAEKLTLVTETGESTFKGTMAFASPEQQVGAKLGFTSDIYSFGKTLHFLCTGSTDPSVDVSDPLLNEIINKCTANSPKLRYQNFDEVRRAFTKPVSQIKCPHCGNKIDPDVKYCPHCGKQPHKQAQKCPKCGKERNGSSRFCDNCGHDYNGSSNDPSNKKITGYFCSRCRKTTASYADGNVKFCNHCGAPKGFLTPLYIK